MHGWEPRTRLRPREGAGQPEARGNQPHPGQPERRHGRDKVLPPGGRRTAKDRGVGWPGKVVRRGGRGRGTRRARAPLVTTAGRDCGGGARSDTGGAPPGRPTRRRGEEGSPDPPPGGASPAARPQGRAPMSHPQAGRQPRGPAGGERAAPRGEGPAAAATTRASPGGGLRRRRGD
nr:proline-rich protein HaeIII subfamily 1-like [Aegilops tauschii subsp. strangulata]